ncbi:MAG: CPBP family intramembrane metalloprotease [Nitrospirota bacterium]|nr:MAG: CPBP family intramembrane metalloprotease [Nitrospirota bacterium]
MTRHGEKASGLALLPPLTTIGFYLLPSHWQSQLVVQWIPQLIAYLAFGFWAFHNVDRRSKLGLESDKIKAGLGWGAVTGIILGCVNTGIILYLVPAFGKDIDFLRHTPHAHIPVWIMVPWFIIFIAIAVEVNFRGFLLGRLLTLFSQITRPSKDLNFLPSFMALGISSLAFAFDPFMVSTFQHLHWIAVWDGFIWGWIWLRTRNLYIPIAAHSMEVIIEYLIIRAALA